MVDRAFDFVSPPDPALMAGCGALSYLGPARPGPEYLAACAASGVVFRFIYESDPNRSQGGYWYGVADAQWSDRRADEVGYSETGPIVVVMSDGNRSSPSSGAPAISDYAEGWARACRRPLGPPYGNRYATDAGIVGYLRVRQADNRGLFLGPHGDGGWLPSTWGADPARDVMSQEANIASPIPATDLNTVHDDAMFGGTVPTPMRRGGKAVLYNSPSGRRLHDDLLFTGVSQAQYDSLKSQGVPELDVDEGIANRITLDIETATAHPFVPGGPADTCSVCQLGTGQLRHNIPTGPGSGGGSGDVTADEVKRIVRAELNATKLAG